MHEHHHEHDEHCSCGCHDHEHEHHTHHHAHDEHCDCGCHDHEHHHHEHDEHCDCGCHDHEHAHVHGRDVDGIHIEHHMQDAACVVSGKTTLEGDYAALRPRIAEALEAVAAEITAQGGIVGHVKAAAEVLNTEMFSVTDVKAMTKTAPTQTICLKMAAIVFAVDTETVEDLVEQTLRTLRG